MDMRTHIGAASRGSLPLPPKSLLDVRPARIVGCTKQPTVNQKSSPGQTKGLKLFRQDSFVWHHSMSSNDKTTRPLLSKAFWLHFLFNFFYPSLSSLTFIFFSNNCTRKKWLKWKLRNKKYCQKQTGAIFRSKNYQQMKKWFAKVK